MESPLGDASKRLVCGNGTRAVLSHGELVWEDTRNMEGEVKRPLLRLSND